MRRAKVQHESFIHFHTLYTPPNILESECNSQQLAIMEGLYVPEPAVLLALADQLENLRKVPPRPRASNLESGNGHGTKDETPKKIKLADTGDTPSPMRRRVNQSIARLRSPLPNHPISMTECTRPAGWGM